MPKTLIEELEAAAQSEATRRSYAQALRHFKAWGGQVPSTATLVAAYIAELSQTHKTATIAHRLIAIHHAHQKAGHTSPVMTSKVKAVMQGIRRTKGTAQRRVHALVKDDLIAALALADKQMPNKTARDRAVLLVGFAGAFRRSELVGIRVEHLHFMEAGVEVLLPRSKTDQEMVGRTVFLPHARGAVCPVKALQNWLALAGIETGLVFRSISRHDHIGARLTAQSVALIVKAAIGRVRGHDAQNYSGHSLRSGFVTQAAMAGLPTFQIKEVTGHRSDATLAKYVRPVQRRKVPSLL